MWEWVCACVCVCLLRKSCLVSFIRVRVFSSFYNCKTVTTLATSLRKYTYSLHTRHNAQTTRTPCIAIVCIIWMWYSDETWIYLMVHAYTRWTATTYPIISALRVYPLSYSLPPPLAPVKKSRIKQALAVNVKTACVHLSPRENDMCACECVWYIYIRISWVSYSQMHVMYYIWNKAKENLNEFLTILHQISAIRREIP